jgi:hypothetical protein
MVLVAYRHGLRASELVDLREHLTEAEVERLMEATKRNRWGPQPRQLSEQCSLFDQLTSAKSIRSAMIGLCGDG